MTTDGSEVQRNAEGAEAARGAGGAVPGPVSGARPRAAPAQACTPLTNRGCFTPRILDSESKTEVEFHLDYLRLTLFCDAERAMEVVAAGLIEPAGIEAGWVDQGPGSRWGRIIAGKGPVELLEPLPSTAGRTYVCLEVKGEGCTFFGDKALRGLLTYLTAQGIEKRGKRFDPCWDHVRFDPATMYDAIRAENINSRCFDAKGRDIWENAEGRTCYLRKQSGEKTQMARLYDRRGFNRFEFQFQGAWADLLCREFEEYPVEHWSRRALVLVRGSVDFVDRKSNERVDRCALLPWWAEFVGAVQKERVALLPRKVPRALHPVGRSESVIIRSARKLRAIARAFGWAYLCDRIEHHGATRYGPDDEIFEEELRPYLASGLAGLGDDADDDAPF